MHHMVRGGERDPPRCAAHLWVRSFAASVEVSVTPREVGTGEFGPMHEFVGDFEEVPFGGSRWYRVPFALWVLAGDVQRSEEHTSELQSRENLVCRLLLEKKKTK